MSTGKYLFIQFPAVDPIHFHQLEIRVRFRVFCSQVFLGVRRVNTGEGCAANKTLGSSVSPLKVRPNG